MAMPLFAKEAVSIGILAYRPKPQTLEQWMPLATALNKAFPDYEFSVHAYDYDELSSAVSKRQIKFILTNPGHYVRLAYQNGLTTPLATLITLENGRPNTLFGGVIFARADRNDIQKLQDIRGKTISAVFTDSLGGYQAQAYELSKAGLSIQNDIRLVLTGMPHDKVIESVLSGRADVGFVRSGLLEQLEREGVLDLTKVKIINQKTYPDFPVRVSTRLYPEWPFASLPYTDKKLKHEVAAFLLNADHDKALVKALNIDGFDVPSNYSPVVDVMRELAVPPFDARPTFTLKDIWTQYPWQISAALIAALLIIFQWFSVLILNRRLESEKHEVRKNIEALHESERRWQFALEGAGDGVWDWNIPTGKVIFSDKWKEMLGYRAAEIGGDLEAWNKCVHPDDLPGAMASMQAYWKGLSRTYVHEHRVICKDGSIKWILDRGMIVSRDAEGNPLRLVGTYSDMTSRRNAEEEIKNLAFYDPLTRLPNRRLLLDRLNQALANSARSGRQGALLFIDLDDFKTLNDTLGHDIGDLLLKQVAERLSACVREGDTVARLGGDEFVIVLEDLSEQILLAAPQIEVIGEKLLASLIQPYRLAGNEQHSSSSIGATLFHGHDLTVDELLKQADIAMYEAKKAGRSALRFFDPQMQANITARVLLETELRKALENNQFQLYYQIQVDSRPRAIGAEALIRWMHPRLGVVSPLVFIPLAEETGMILPIGSWVLETACAQLKAWEGRPDTRGLQLAINVSALQFRQVDFVEQVCAALRQSAISPDRLKLELTESLVLADIDDTVNKMNSLREIGVHFSMDDFGTGYSSLSSLKKLPLTQLKIDQSFVRDVTTDQDDAVIVQTIIAMARNLGIDVIAEGVETEEQRAFLEANDCSVFQGYLFSKPVPLDAFEALLALYEA